MARILIVDDEPSIVGLVSAYLKSEGHQVLTAPDGPSGLRAAHTHKPDLILLDVMLPGMDGIELLERLRRDSDVFVIMLTARTEEADKVMGLMVGADDYVTKPFSPRELMARVNAALRRLHGGVEAVQEDGGVLAFQHLRLDRNSRTVTVDGEGVDLTAIEFDLLSALMENPGHVLSREQLLERVWGVNSGTLRVVDVHMGHIRQKLGLPDLIGTVRGVGYRFEDEPK